MGKRSIKETIKSWRRDRHLKRQSRLHDEAIQPLFDDFYQDRGRIYKLNFVRGIFFGLGSAIGGTIVLATTVYLLSWFIDVPIIGDGVDRIIETVPATR